MKIVDLKEKNQLFEERCKELEAKERQMDFAKRELESKQKQLDDRIRELELKEKKLANIIQIRVGADQSERNSPSLDLGFVVTMFGKGLQLFLNEHVKYHDSIAGKVLEALKQSIDPAKLILDAMEGFYPPHLKKGNFEFEGSVVRRSCILLLEQIMKISPTIRTDVREAALGIAAEWKTKMKPVVENWSEVLGFLSLLAAYELGGDFDVDELLSLYKIVPQHRQTPDLFMLLGFTDEIGGATSKQRKRSLDLGKCYDSARNAARKPRLPPKQLIQDKIPNISTFQFGGLNDHRSTQPDLSDGRQSFWTCCPFCTMKYKYYQDFVNRSLRCQNCSKPFIAYDLGARPVSNQAHTGSNRGQPQVSQQKQVPTKSFKLGARSSGPFNSFYLRSEANSSRKMGSEHVTRTRGTAEVGGGLKNNVKGIAHVNTEEGNTVDAAKTRESGTSRDGKMKRGTPPKRSHENTIGAHDATLSNQANPGSEDSTHSFGRAQPPISQKQVPTKACNMGAHSSGEFPSYNFGSDANSNRKVGSEYVTRTGGTTEVGGGLKNKVRGNVRVNTEANRGVGMSKVDAANARVSWTSRDKNRKRGRKLAVDSSESFDTTTSSDSEEVEFEESGGSPAVHNSRSESVHSPRRSSRQKQNVSYNENAIDDDFMSPPKSSHERKYSDAKEDQKEPFNNEEFKVEVNKKEIKRKRSEPAEGSSQYANDGAVKHQVNVEEDVTLDSGAKKYSVIDDSEAKPNLGSTSDPEVYECPDPEFSDFDKDKDEKCFSVDQVWACYDTIDGMPRFYAQVKKVFSPGFKLRFTWLEVDPEEQGEIDWVNEGLPVGCGKFTRGDTEETSDCLTFSHLIHFEKGIGRGSYVIYPRRGETWALFKDWDIGWSSDSENHKKYIFEIVEILSDFSHDTGIMIGCLAKIKGFVSLFQRTTRGGVGSCLIPSSELLRFSHRIPSFKMTGAERDGVPEGSFELDPASLPTDPNELWQPEEEKVEAQSMSVKVNSSSSDGKVKSTIGSENSSTPKKCGL